MAYVLHAREAVLRGNSEAASVSTAFRSEGEARLQLALHATGRVSRGERPILAALRTLVRALEDKLGIDAWYLAYGLSPDELSTTHELAALPEDLRARLAERGASEVALALAFLATPTPKPSRVLPAVLQGFEFVGRRRLSLAIEIKAAALSASLDTWIAAAPESIGLWIADPSLGVRFTLSRFGIRFRAHHPVIHAALIERCRKSGIDLV